MRALERPLVVVVGSGGVGKTTIAAALALEAARAGDDTLVMTFDPSRRLKDALGVGDEAAEREVEVPLPAEGSGRLAASLLDAGRTFDRLVARYAPDEAARERILGNRFYRRLSGSLGGILEYMAVERLFEVAEEGRYRRVFLDTPPTRQALDFLEAPDRIVSFLDSGALKVALRPWFDDGGRFRPTSGWGPLGKGVDRYLDRVVGLDLLRDVAEFFQAFAPLYAGFHRRAERVKQLLASEETAFVLVAGPSAERVPDTLFFARRLLAAGFHLGPLVVNRVHPLAPAGEDASAGERLMAWLGERDRRGIEELSALLAPGQSLVEIPLLDREPDDLAALAELGERIGSQLASAAG